MNREDSEANPNGKPALLRFLECPRLEIFPAKEVEEQIDYLPKDAKIAVTCLKKISSLDNALELTEQLRRKNFTVVTHIPAHSVIDKGHLKEILERLQHAGVKEIFVPRGDREKPISQETKEKSTRAKFTFPTSLDLLRAMADIGHDFEEIGIAGHPKGIRSVPKDTLLQALREKQPLATYIVTQMCLNPMPIVRWIAEIRESGIELPMYIGIPGGVDMKKLVWIAKRIGVADSMGFFLRNFELLGMWLHPRLYTPTKILTKLSSYCEDPGYNIEGFHIYTFNQVSSTENWRNKFLADLTPTP